MSVRFQATATDRALGDHVCWPFHGLDDLVQTARAYVREGLDRHERVSFCRIDPAGIHHADISHVDQVGRPPDADLPVLTPVVAETPWTPSQSPIAAFERMTEEALANGFAGLRVITDATEVVRDEGTRPLWVRGEHLLDRYGLHHPLAVLCGYDADLLGPDILAEVACLHALTGGPLTSFLLRAADADGTLALVGEVDRASAPDLVRAVTALAGDLPRPVVLDLTEHEFLDHSALVALDRAALSMGTTIDLVGASALTSCLVDVLELTGVRVREES